MKKIYLILGWLILISSLATAQNRLIQENRIWEYTHSWGYNIWFESFCFDGTQELYGKTYHQWKLINRVSWTTNPETEPVETPINEVKALLREEDGKVYILLEGKTIRDYNSETKTLSAPFEAGEAREAILYDFTASKGETYPGITEILWQEEYKDYHQFALSNCTVIETGSFALREGSVRKYKAQSDVNVALVKNINSFDTNGDTFLSSEIKLDRDEEDKSIIGNLEHQSKISYAEIIGNIGRGDLTDLIPEMAIFLTSGIRDYHISYLICVYDTDGTIIYGNPSKVISPEFQQSEIEKKIYDLLGNRVSKTIPGSIYIMNGKKFVAK